MDFGKKRQTGDEVVVFDFYKDRSALRVAADALSDSGLPDALVFRVLEQSAARPFEIFPSSRPGRRGKFSYGLGGMWISDESGKPDLPPITDLFGFQGYWWKKLPRQAVWAGVPKKRVTKAQRLHVLQYGFGRTTSEVFDMIIRRSPEVRRATRTPAKKRKR